VVTWKRAFFGLLALFFGVTGFLLYAVVDQGISYSYLKTSFDDSNRSLQLLAALYPLDRYNKKDVVHIIRKQVPDALIVERPSFVSVDGLRFDFDAAGHLQAISVNAMYEVDPECVP
jgi:hypothetical protein